MNPNHALFLSPHILVGTRGSKTYDEGSHRSTRKFWLLSIKRSEKMGRTGRGREGVSIGVGGNLNKFYGHFRDVKSVYFQVKA